MNPSGPEALVPFRIPFLRLDAAGDRDDLERAVRRVMDRGWYVLGPELEAFEREFAAASGARYAVGTGSGTDALALSLRGLGIGPGDEVITTPLSAAYTCLAILMAGACPVFADVDPMRLTLDPGAALASVSSRTVAILVVHLYGQAADMTALGHVARRHGLALVEDCCQAHLATANEVPVGTLGAAGAFSFYPTKNLGALGDAGMLVTADPDLAERVRVLRNGGQTRRWYHAVAGINSRLDEIQAAILRVRLPRLASSTARRRSLAARYRAQLADAPLQVPVECDAGHVYHLFPVRSHRRSAMMRHLAAAGIETRIHYPVPIPRQPALSASQPADCPVANTVCSQVLSLPLHQGLEDEVIDEVADAVRTFAG